MQMSMADRVGYFSSYGLFLIGVLYVIEVGLIIVYPTGREYNQYPMQQLHEPGACTVTGYCCRAG